MIIRKSKSVVARSRRMSFDVPERDIIRAIERKAGIKITEIGVFYPEDGEMTVGVVDRDGSTWYGTIRLKSFEVDDVSMVVNPKGEFV